MSLVSISLPSKISFTVKTQVYRFLGWSFSGFLYKCPLIPTICILKEGNSINQRFKKLDI